MICRKCGGALPSDHDDPDPIHDDCHHAEVDELRLDDQMREAGVNPIGRKANVDDGTF